MAPRNRQINRPDRRIAPSGYLSGEEKKRLLNRLKYEGAAFHKLHPADYGFTPPVAPRPSKSTCDDIRIIPLGEAKELFRSGIEQGMVSTYPSGSVPKYIWAIDAQGEIYEAKTHPDRDDAYHGYRLNDDDNVMRKHIRKEWNRRSNES